MPDVSGDKEAIFDKLWAANPMTFGLVGYMGTHFGIGAADGTQGWRRRERPELAASALSRNQIPHGLSYKHVTTRVTSRAASQVSQRAAGVSAGRCFSPLGPYGIVRQTYDA